MNGFGIAGPGPCTRVVSLGVMGTLRALCSVIPVLCGIGFEVGLAVIALATFCVRKDLVLSLTASSAAPPILALLSIPTEFKMVSF